VNVGAGIRKTTEGETSKKMRHESSGGPRIFAKGVRSIKKKFRW